MKSMKAKWLLTLLSGTGAGLYPVLSSALGLGDIHVDSRLNQALRARVEIVGVSDEEWRVIRASIAAQSVAGGDAAHPELLDSVTLTPIEDAEHRRFIQVKSSAIFTEPLFDLPIEVSDPAAHVVRSYAVLLDPEGTVNAPQAVAQSGSSHADAAVPVDTVAQPAKADSATVAPRATAARRHVGRHHSKRASKHGRSRQHAPSASPTSSLASTSNAAPTSGAASPPAATSSAAPAAGSVPATAQGVAAAQTNAQVPASAKDQLERQLATLQQTLAQMQATIAAQDAEIAKLTRVVASGAPASERSAARTGEAQSATAAAVAQADSDVDSADETEPTSFWARPGFFARVAAGLGLAALLAAIGLWLARRRKAEAAREASVEDRYARAGKEAPQKSYQMPQPSSYQVEEHSGVSDVVASTKAAERDDDQDGVESWLTQSALLEQDVLSATGALPVVTDEAEDADPAGHADHADRTGHADHAGRADLAGHAGHAGHADATRQPSHRTPASGLLDDEKTLELHQTLDSLEMQQTLESLELQQTLEVPRPSNTQHTVQMRRTLSSLSLRPSDGPENRDVVKELEHTLDIEPDRVDVQLKLLEIYHHEALGNRDNFHLLLSRVNVEQEALSPAQRSHLEMLQRTLEDGKSDADSHYAVGAAL